MSTGFLAAILGVLAPADDPAARAALDAIRREHREANGRWEATYERPQADGRPVDPIPRYRDWPAWDFAARYVAFAERFPGDPAALEALVEVVELGRAVGEGDERLLPPYGKAVDLLLEHHRDDERVARLILDVTRDLSPPAERFLRTLADTAKDGDTRLRAKYGLATLLTSRRLVARRPWFDHTESPFQAYLKDRFDPAYLRYIRETDGEAADKEAEGLLKTVAAGAGDLAELGGRDRKLRELAETALFKLQNLEIGRVAPDIVGEDLAGETFKLGDYRGKVVVLTFSGEWSDSSKALHVAEAALVNRFASEPFVLLSVNTDANKLALLKAVEEGTITWRCWLDGGTDGPICRKWDLPNFPMTYVLDGRGVIRDKDVRAERLEEVVRALLDDAKR